MTRIRAILVVLCLLSLSALASAAPRRGREVDQIWTHPSLESMRLTSVAVLPAASFDNVLQAELNAEAELLRAIHGAGYRWISATTTRDMLRRDGGDSLFKAVRTGILERGPADSAAAPGLCARFRVNGLLCVRVERAEQLSIQSDQSGSPTTTVAVRAVLVDSLGRRLWSASGTNIQEAPALEAAPTGGVGMGGQLANTPNEKRNNAPTWQEALVPLFARWAPTFPHRGGADSTAAGR